MFQNTGHPSFGDVWPLEEEIKHDMTNHHNDIMKEMNILLPLKRNVLAKKVIHSDQGDKEEQFLKDEPSLQHSSKGSNLIELLNMASCISGAQKQHLESRPSR